MKIAFFVSGFPSFSETFVFSQIAGLVERGHSVDIYPQRIHTERIAYSDIARYKLLDCIYPRRAVGAKKGWRKYWGRLGILMRSAWKYPGLVIRALNPIAFGRRALSLAILDMALCFVNRPRYDIVHCHFGQNGNDAAILMKLGVLHGKLVTTFHGWDIRAGIPDSGKRYAPLKERCDAVHCISEYNRMHLEAFGFDRRRIFFHPMGIDLTRFQQKRYDLGDGAGAKHVGMVTVARLEEIKGLRFALRALANVRAQLPDIQLSYRIVGGGPLEGSLRQMARELGIADSVEFLGPQDQSVVARVLGESDIFLLPSIMEALPVSIMEAMATGLAVVATDVGSVSELVTDRVTGWLAPASDERALSEALLSCIDERHRWADYARAGRDLVAARYDVEKLNNRLVNHYQALLGGG